MTPPFDHTAWLILSNSLHPVILWGRRIKGRGSGKRWGENMKEIKLNPQCKSEACYTGHLLGLQ